MALIVCCSPAASDAEETISSLMYGTCAKAILWVKQVMCTSCKASIMQCYLLAISDGVDITKLSSVCPCTFAAIF